jgi:predicted NACHT family NTPase
VLAMEGGPRGLATAVLTLAGNPLLLTVMAVIYKDHDLPNERWRLYERCAGTLLEDWDIGRGIEAFLQDQAVTEPNSAVHETAWSAETTL